MNLVELKSLLLNKKFLMDEATNTYAFISDDIMRIEGAGIASVRYNLYEEDGKFYLDHNRILGNEDLHLTIDNVHPLILVLSHKSSLSLWGVWVEEHLRQSVLP